MEEIISYLIVFYADLAAHGQTDTKGSHGRLHAQIRRSITPSPLFVLNKKIKNRFLYKVHAYSFFTLSIHKKNKKPHHRYK